MLHVIAQDTLTQELGQDVLLKARGRRLGSENKIHAYLEKRTSKTGRVQYIYADDKKGGWKNSREGRHVPAGPVPDKKKYPYQHKLYHGKFHDKNGNFKADNITAGHLIHELTPLLHHISKKYGVPSRALNHDDVFSAASIGALKGVMRYKPYLHLSSIGDVAKREIFNMLKTMQGRHYRLNVAESYAYRNYRQHFNKLMASLGREPTEDEFLSSWSLLKKQLHSSYSGDDQVPVDGGYYASDIRSEKGAEVSKKRKVIEQKYAQLTSDAEADAAERIERLDQELRISKKSSKRNAEHYKDLVNWRKEQKEAARLAWVASQSSGKKAKKNESYDIWQDSPDKIKRTAPVPELQLPTLEAYHERLAAIEKEFEYHKSQMHLLTDDDYKSQVAAVKLKLRQKTDELHDKMLKEREEVSPPTSPGKRQLYKMFRALDSDREVNTGGTVTDSSYGGGDDLSAESAIPSQHLNYDEARSIVDAYRGATNKVVNGLDRMNADSVKSRKDKAPLGQILKLHFRLAPLPEYEWQPKEEGRVEWTKEDDLLPPGEIAKLIKIPRADGSGFLNHTTKVNALVGMKGEGKGQKARSGLLAEALSQVTKYVPAAQWREFADAARAVRENNIDVESPEFFKGMDKPKEVRRRSKRLEFIRREILGEEEGWQPKNPVRFKVVPVLSFSEEKVEKAIVYAWPGMHLPDEGGPLLVLGEEHFHPVVIQKAMTIVRAPLTGDGRVDWGQIPAGASCWITINDPSSPLYRRHVLVTMRPDGLVAYRGGTAASHISGEHGTVVDPNELTGGGEDREADVQRASQAMRHATFSPGKVPGRSKADAEYLKTRDEAIAFNEPIQTQLATVRGMKRQYTKEFLTAAGMKKARFTKEDRNDIIAFAKKAQLEKWREEWEAQGLSSDEIDSKMSEYAVHAARLAKMFADKVSATDFQKRRAEALAQKRMRDILFGGSLSDESSPFAEEDPAILTAPGEGVVTPEGQEGDAAAEVPQEGPLEDRIEAAVNDPQALPFEGAAAVEPKLFTLEEQEKLSPVDKEVAIIQSIHNAQELEEGTYNPDEVVQDGKVVIGADIPTAQSRFDAIKDVAKRNAMRESYNKWAQSRMEEKVLSSQLRAVPALEGHSAYAHIRQFGLEPQKMSQTELAELESEFEKSLARNTDPGLDIYQAILPLWGGTSLAGRETRYAELKQHMDDGASAALSSMVGSYLGYNIAMRRLVENLGGEGAVYVLAKYIHEFTKPEMFATFTKRVEADNMARLEKTEKEAVARHEELDERERLLVHQRDSEQSLLNKQAFNKQLGDVILKKQENLGQAIGSLSASANLYHALRKVSKDKNIDNQQISLTTTDKAEAENRAKELGLKAGRYTVSIGPRYGDGTQTWILSIPLGNLTTKRLMSAVKVRTNHSRTIASVKSADANGVDTMGQKVLPSIEEYQLPGFKSEFVDTKGESQKFTPRIEQRNGLEFLRANGGNGIIAAMTGAGKTNTVLAGAIDHMKTKKDYLQVVACPPGQTGQWVAEAQRYTNLKVAKPDQPAPTEPGNYIVEVQDSGGWDERKKAYTLAATIRSRGNGVVLVASHKSATTPGTKDSPKDVYALEMLQPDGLAIDESQKLYGTNKKGQRVLSAGGKRLLGLNVKHRTAATATPASENISEMFDMVNWAFGKRNEKGRLVASAHHGLGRKKEFLSAFANYGHGTNAQDRNLEQLLQRRLAPFVIGDDMTKRSYKETIHYVPVKRTKAQIARQQYIEKPENYQAIYDDAKAKAMKAGKYDPKTMTYEQRQRVANKAQQAVDDLHHNNINGTLTDKDYGVSVDGSTAVTSKHNAKIAAMLDRIPAAKTAAAKDEANKHIIITDGTKRQRIAIYDALMREHGYKREQIADMTANGGPAAEKVTERPARIEAERERWKAAGSTIPIVLIDPSTLAGHNLQEANHVHTLGVPKNVADFIQGRGRAGRDPRGGRNLSVHVYRHSDYPEELMRYDNILSHQRKLLQAVSPAVSQVFENDASINKSIAYVVVLESPEFIAKGPRDWEKPGHKYFRRYRGESGEWRYEYYNSYGMATRRPLAAVYKHPKKANFFNVESTAEDYKSHEALRDKMRGLLSYADYDDKTQSWSIHAQHSNDLHAALGDKIAFSDSAKKHLEKVGEDDYQDAPGIVNLGEYGLKVSKVRSQTVVFGSIKSHKDLLYKLGGKKDEHSAQYIFHGVGPEELAHRIETQLEYNDHLTRNYSSIETRLDSPKLVGNAHVSPGRAGVQSSASEPTGAGSLPQPSGQDVYGSDDEPTLDWLSAVQRPKSISKIKPEIEAALRHPDLSKESQDNQVADVEGIVSCFERGGIGHLLALEPGMGKTYCACAAIAQQNPAEVLWTIPSANIDLLTEQIGDAAANFGWKVKRVGRHDKLVHEPKTIIVSTYLDIAFNNELSKGYDLVVGDEAHRAANITEGGASKSGLAMQHITTLSKHTLWLTASPFETVADMAYLENLGAWEKGDFRRFAVAHGVRVATRSRKDPATGELVKYNTYQFVGTKKDLLKVFSRLIHMGAMTHRRAKFDKNLDNNFSTVTANPHLSEMYTKVTHAFDIMARAVSSKGAIASPGSVASMLKMQKAAAARRIMEAAKIDDAVKVAQHAVKNGRQVLITTQYRSPAVKNMLEFLEGMGEGSSPVVKKRIQTALDKTYNSLEGRTLREYLSSVTMDIPSPVDELTRRLGGSDMVAEAHGGITGFIDKNGKKVSRKAANIADYKSGKKLIMVGTADTLSTGGSYHHTSKGSDKPRTQINLTIPWTAREAAQLWGRSHREGSKSDTQQHWLFVDTPTERRAAATVGTRLKHMGASVHGIEDHPDAESLSNFDLGRIDHLLVDDSILPETEDPVEAQKRVEQAQEVQRAAVLSNRYGEGYNPREGMANLFKRRNNG